MTRSKKNLFIAPLKSTSPEIGRALWMLEDTRLRTLEALEGLDPQMIDWHPAPGINSIGALIYHVALIETSWLFEDVLQAEFPAEVLANFPYEDRDELGKLLQAAGMSLDDHLQRLRTVRAKTIAVFATMSREDFYRKRTLPLYEVTPEWVLHHLMQHEAEHRGQIEELRTLADKLILT